jgi:hypothetical protein
MLWQPVKAARPCSLPPPLYVPSLPPWQVSQDIITQLRLRDPLLLTSSFNRPNIRYSVHLLDVPLEEGLPGGGGGGEEGGRTVSDLQRLLRLIQAQEGNGGRCEGRLPQLAEPDLAGAGGSFSH